MTYEANKRAGIRSAIRGVGEKESESAEGEPEDVWGSGVDVLGMLSSRSCTFLGRVEVGGAMSCR
jgi:hypothetical protein